jgi:glutamate/tyrosine decarboxylase-like PLP-dependent enzyme
MEDKREEYLGYFLGPKSENAKIFEDALLILLRDYAHWRKNYFPSDELLINKGLQREFEENNEILYETIDKMMALLRRNFPFYSPRYIGHMLSDITLPSMIGYFAGMLFNPNNVTPEAAPVTTHLEIEACNNILKMIGYTPPPQPSLDKDKEKIYSKRLLKEYGWAHITPGGTISNIEALWIAKAVKYFPLAVRKVAQKRNLDIKIKVGSSDYDIKDKGISDGELLLLNPKISIYLMENYVEAVRSKFNFNPREAHKEAWNLMKEENISITKLSHEYQPLIFTSGTAHYSIKKAADILGIGRENVMMVKMDSRFRMDIEDLRKKIEEETNISENKREKKIPLAVVATFGTTEEGAIDQVDKIIELREDLESKEKISFWIHVDAAWGGYIRSLFNLEQSDLIKKLLNTIKVELEESHDYSIGELNEALFKYLEDKFYQSNYLRIDDVRNDVRLEDNFKNEIIGSLNKFMSLYSPNEERNSEKNGDKYGKGHLNAYKKELKKAGNFNKSTERIADILYDIAKKENNNFLSYIRDNSRDNFKNLIPKIENEYIRRFKREIYYLGTLKEAFNQKIASKDYDILDELMKLSKSKLVTTYCPKFKENVEKIDRDEVTLDELKKYMQEDVTFKFNLMNRLWQTTRTISWSDKDIYKSFMEIHKADSVTVDPHKMGYLPYPNGAIAFRNDRVRYFVWQEAPYITSSEISVYQPPKHLMQEGSDKEKIEKIAIDAFGPFILEGSRPGASACALWLSTHIIPLTMKKHGSIVRASLLSARMLYEALTLANSFLDQIGRINIKFVPLTCDEIGSEIKPVPGDTNLVTFVIKIKTSQYIKDMNELTEKVYKEFTILEELGEREYSYAQPFFLSETKFSEPNYPFDTLKNFFKMCGILQDGRSENEVRKEYKEIGLTVIRATVMNPYLFPMEKYTPQSLIGEFFSELVKVSERKAKEILSRST